MEDADDLYKVIELSRVTDAAIERELNRMHREGWTFRDIRFAMLDGVRRPAMAFLFFLRTDAADVTDISPEVRSADGH